MTSFDKFSILASEYTLTAENPASVSELGHGWFC
jgi:hypothetical protein